MKSEACANSEGSSIILLPVCHWSQVLPSVLAQDVGLVDQQVRIVVVDWVEQRQHQDVIRAVRRADHQRSVRWVVRREAKLYQKGLGRSLTECALGPVREENRLAGVTRKREHMGTAITRFWRGLGVGQEGSSGCGLDEEGGIVGSQRVAGGGSALRSGR